MTEDAPRGRLALIGGAAAALGGALWIVKGAAIIATGDQPPVVYEAAVPLFAVGLLGLSARAGPGETRLARTGAALAVTTLVLLLATGALSLAGGLRVSEESFTAGSALVLATFVALLAGLVVLGVATRRAAALGPRWSALPLAMGLAAVPLVVTGGVLGAVDERLLEAPIVAFGLAWVALGVAVATGGEGGRERP